MFDSGIRRAADIFKALALGARPVLWWAVSACWGLAVAGEEGVREVLLNLPAGLDLTMALSGYACCRNWTPPRCARVVRQSCCASHNFSLCIAKLPRPAAGAIIPFQTLACGPGHAFPVTKH